MWVPVKRVETKAAKNSVDLSAIHGLEIIKHQAEGVVNNIESSDDGAIGLVTKKIIGREENNGVKVHPVG